MRPVPATSPRQGLVGGVASLALHGLMIGAALWGIGGAPPVPPEETMVVEVALAPAATFASAEPEAPAVTPAPVRPSAVEPPPVPNPVRPAIVSRPVSSPSAAQNRPAAAAPVIAGSDGAAAAQTVGAGVSDSPAGAVSPAGSDSADRLPASSGTPRRAARPLDAPPPAYPLAARRRGLEGRVVLRLDIDAAGQVAEVRIEHSSGSAMLDEAAAQAARSWRFHPAALDGQTVAASVAVPIRFQLSGVAVASAE